MLVQPGVCQAAKVDSPIARSHLKNHPRMGPAGHGLYPGLLTLALFGIAVVLAFNFVGDGLRDAADPYTA